jgi:hypothetical protein
MVPLCHSDKSSAANADTAPVAERTSGFSAASSWPEADRDAALRDWYRRRREGLAELAEPPLEQLAQRSAVAWGDRAALDRILQRSREHIRGCSLLYASDARGRQVTSNVHRDGMDRSKCGQELAERPFLQASLWRQGYWVSDIYICKVTARTCLTAVHAVTGAAGLVGFVGVDFDLASFGPVVDGSGSNSSTLLASAE